MTAKEIIQSLGGYRAVAAQMPCDATRVFRWQDEGIPAHRWPRVLQIAGLKHVEVTLDMLVATAPARAQASA